MGIHGRSSCEKGPRAPNRSKDPDKEAKAIEKAEAADKKTAKKKSSKKVAHDVANDQAGSQEADTGNESHPDG